MNDDLSGLSNEQLMAMLQSMPPDGQPAAPRRRAAGPMNDDLGGLSDQDLMAELQSMPPEPAQPTTPEAQRFASLSPEQRQWLQQGNQQPTAQDFSGNQVPIEQLSEAAKMGHGLANTLEDFGLGATQLANDAVGGGIRRLFGAETTPGMPSRESQLSSEAMAMQSRQAPIDATLSGTIGGALPALAIPVGGPVKAGATVAARVGQLLKGLSGTAAGGAAYGALQPVTGEGQRGRNALEGAAAFVGGDVVGRGVGALSGRIRYPQLGGKQTSKPAQARQAARQSGIDELEQQGFKVTTGQRSGSSIVQGIESVFPEIITTSGAAGRMAAENKVKLNEIVAKSFGKGNVVSRTGVINDDVIAKAAKTIGAKIESSIPADAVIAPSTKMIADMAGMTSKVEGGLPSRVSSPVRAAISDIYEKFGGVQAASGSGKTALTKQQGINGETYRTITSQLTDLRRELFKAGDRRGAMHTGQIQKIIDDRVEESLREASPQALKAFRSARRQWGGLRIAEESIDAAGDVQAGMLKDAVKRHRPQDLVPRVGRKRSDLGTLAKNVKVLQQVIPNSGTPMRTGAKALIQGAQGGAGLYGGYELQQGNLTPAAAALLGPIAVQRLLYSPRFARYASRTPNAMAGQGGGFGNALSQLSRTGLGLGGYGALQSGNQ